MGLIGKDIDVSIKEVESPLDIVPEFETGFELVQKFNPREKAKQYQISAA